MTLWPFLLASTLLIPLDLVYSKEKDETLNQTMTQDPWHASVSKYAEQVAAHIEESQSTVKVLQDYACVEYDALKDTYWALKWADRFKEKGANLSDWTIAQDCPDLSKSHEATCDSANVQLRSGLLLLLAKEVSSSAKPGRFTSGLVLTPNRVTFDRLQLRLALPLGSHLSTSIVALNPWPFKRAMQMLPPDVHRHLEARRFKGHTLTELLHADPDYLVLLNHTQNVSPLSHGLVLNETTHLKGVHQGAAESGELSHFHTHEVVWTEGGLEFTLDGAISRITHRRLRRVEQHLMLVIGVGGSEFSDPVPEESEALNWICPALIVDSVRVFDRVSQEFAKSLERCTFPKQTDDSIIEEICPKLKSLPNWRKTAGNAQTIGRIVFLVALAGILPVAIFILVKFTFLGNSRALKLKFTYRRNEPILQFNAQEPNMVSVN